MGSSRWRGSWTEGWRKVRGREGRVTASLLASSNSNHENRNAIVQHKA